MNVGKEPRGRAHEWLRNNLLGLVAIFIALSGTAIATVPKNSVTSKKIKNGQVKTADLGANAVKAGKLAANAVNGAKVADNSLTGADVSGLTGADVNDNSLTGADVNEATLSGLPLTGAAGGALTGNYPDPNIAADAVGGAQIANFTIANADLATGAVDSDVVLNGSLTGADINEASLDTPLWAVVTAGGSVNRASVGGVTVDTSGPVGDYEVDFNAGNIDPCASVANLSDPSFGGSVPSGEAGAGQGQDNDDEIHVNTFNSAGGAADNPFTVVVIC